MTAPTPPFDRDEPDRGDLAVPDDFEARLELLHASVDGELTPAENSAVRADEQWRALVEETRGMRDLVQAALVLDGPDETRRESHLAAALAEFDAVALSGSVASDSLPPPTGHAHDLDPPTGDPHGGPAAVAGVQAVPPPPPGSAPGDQLAQRRDARNWVSKLPIGIAAAVLAAVVVVGATQMSDDGEDTTSLADAADLEADIPSSDDAGSDSEFGSVHPGDSANESPAAPDDEMISYTLNAKPGSLDAFSQSVSATGRGGNDMPASALPTDSPDLTSDCTKFDVIDLLHPGINPNDLTLVEGVVEGRDVVGVVARSSPNDVIIIDLERCEVVSEP